jgi:tetratricopeptide (TPR) repeat protein
MSKEGTATMIVVFPLMAWFFTRAKTVRIVTGAVAMVIPAAVYIFLRHNVLSETPDIWGLAPIDNFLVLAPDWGTRVATAVMILGKYIWLLIFPHPLASDYSYAQIPFAGLTSPGFLLSAFIYLFIILIILLSIRKREPWIFGLIFLIVSISIYSNLFFLIGTNFGERLLFVPSLGYCMAWLFILKNSLPESADDVSKLTWSSSYLKRWPIVLMGMIIILYSVKSVERIRDWENDKTLIYQDVKTNPHSARLQNHLGNMFRDQARDEQDPKLRHLITRKSLSAYQQALRIFPSHEDSQEQVGLAWYILGYPDMGIFYFKMVLKKNPLRQDAWNNLGNIYTDKGDLPAALDAFKRATSINPWFADAWRNSGSLLGRMGRYEEAIPCFLKALELEPNDILAAQFLGLTYQNLGRPEDARYWFGRAGVPVSR